MRTVRSKERARGKKSWRKRDPTWRKRYPTWRKSNEIGEKVNFVGEKKYIVRAICQAMAARFYAEETVDRASFYEMFAPDRREFHPDLWD